MSRILNHSNQPAKRSLVNVDRYLKRVKEAIRQALKKKIEDSASGGFSDIWKGQEVTLKTTRQPGFFLKPTGGERLFVIPGNTIFVPGDVIPKPPAQSGERGQAGEGDEDGFVVDLTEEMVRDVYFEDMELPDLTKKQLMDMTSPEWKRAGYKSEGSPNLLAIGPTARKALMRRNALGRPKKPELRNAEARLADLLAKDILTAEEQAECAELTQQILVMKRKRSAIPYMDKDDLRYRRFELVPKPVAQAVMFCLMDVSGSMNEHLKDLARGFFALLYMFLKRNYTRLDVVFVRHTEKAEEVTEEEFFKGALSGGTVVLSALDKMSEIIAERYNPADWNIYGCQASDGDAQRSDAMDSAFHLESQLLELCQFYAYIEVTQSKAHTSSSIWNAYNQIEAENFAMKIVNERKEISVVFRQLFEKGEKSRRVA